MLLAWFPFPDLTFLKSQQGHAQIVHLAVIWIRTDTGREVAIGLRLLFVLVKSQQEPLHSVQPGAIFILVVMMSRFVFLMTSKSQHDPLHSSHPGANV